MPSKEEVISTRWVDVNKGDELRPKYRLRLVARELKVKCGQSETHWSDFFATMPPLTALRILFTIAVTKKIPNKDGKLISLGPTTCVIFIDIKKAHFWSPARRRLLVATGNGLSARHGRIAQEVSVWNSWRSRKLGGGDQGCDASTWIFTGEEQCLFVFPWRATHSDRGAWRWFYRSWSEKRIGMVCIRAQEVLDCGCTRKFRSTTNEQC